MSTFNGIVKEFPNIRIDYFRRGTDNPPPAACFLSHVHSDHLQGLESLKMPFVYCSVATKRLLLRMEKYPHRINFAKGILEARKQHYRHLKLVLRTLPMQTPTELELGPKSKIQVTLFDANHCPGAVMFLIEGDGKAILYTGDIRSEMWWVNTFTQSPFVLPYTTGLRSLDCIYLDTTFASWQDEYKVFPSKASGIKELLQKISSLPEDTIFYVKSWTLGYENIWLALSNVLKSKVHVDDYQLRLFAALAESGRENHIAAEAPSLVGFVVGHNEHPGCLTDDSNARIHSCEPGTACYVNLSKKDNVVWIIPIISRLDDGTEIQELGAGGGLGDLYQVPELEFGENAAFEMLDQLFTDTLKDKKSLQKARNAVTAMHKTGGSKLSLVGLDLDREAETSLQDFVRLISSDGKSMGHLGQVQMKAKNQKIIHFPYSRHSSHEELRHLVSAFRPKDICACTVELDTWSDRISMETLFGDLCSAAFFHHDGQVKAQANEIQRLDQLRKPSKRKRGDDSPSPDTENESPPQSDFESALDSQHHAVKAARTAADGYDKQVQQPIPEVALRESRTLHTQVHSEGDNLQLSDQEQGQLQIVESCFRTGNRGSNTIFFEAGAPKGSDAISTPASDSQTSVNTLQVESQPDIGENVLPMYNNNIDITDSIGTHQINQQPSKHRGQRYITRKSAYQAARLSLQDGSTSWHDLMLRSVGSRGHTEDETEL